jgi:hypothetical protein
MPDPRPFNPHRRASARLATAPRSPARLQERTTTTTSNPTPLGRQIWGPLHSPSRSPLADSECQGRGWIRAQSGTATTQRVWPSHPVLAAWLAYLLIFLKFRRVLDLAIADLDGHSAFSSPPSADHFSPISEQGGTKILISQSPPTSY